MPRRKATVEKSGRGGAREGAGRPPVVEGAVMLPPVRISAATKASLAARAAELGVSLAEVVRQELDMAAKRAAR